MDVLDKLIYLARLRGRIDVCCRLGGGVHLEHKTEPETARLHWVVTVWRVWCNRQASRSFTKAACWR